MSVVRGMRGVAEMCEMRMCLCMASAVWVERGMSE